MKTNGSMCELSVIIPCFNEADNIDQLIEGIAVTSKDYKTSFEVIFVDGGSTDSSREKILNCSQAHNLQDVVQLVVSKGGNGYGGDIQLGLSRAKGLWLAWTHADNQCDFSDTLRLMEKLRTMQSDSAVVGKGRRSNRPFLDMLFTKGMQLVTHALLGKSFHDINGQPKVFPREFYDSFVQGQAPSDFSLDLYFLYQAQKNDYKLISIPVDFHKRKFGIAKGGGGNILGKLKLTKRTLAYILQLRQYLDRR